MIELRDIELMKNYRNISGIYFILEEKSKRIYVGSSVDIYRRTRNHYTELKFGSHSNEYMQRVWNKSEQSFMVGILEIVKDKNKLLIREQYWMDFFQSANRSRGFNLTPTAGSNLGYKKTKEQIENNIMAIRGTKNTKLTEIEAVKVKEMINEGLTLTRIAKKMNVDYETVRSIRRGHSYKYVNPQIDHELCLRAKLVEEDVIEIKRMINKGYKVKDIAGEYDISHRTVSAIKNEINWKNIGEKITVEKRKKRNERSA